jgi:hypothetical protein
MATIADKIMAISPGTSATVEAITTEPNIRQEVEELKRTLTREIEGIKMSQKPRKAKDTGKELCWYHQRFGHKMSRALRIPGKRPRLSLDNSMSPIDQQPHSRRLFITDRISKIPFLIDSGADISAIPRQMKTGSEGVRNIVCMQPTERKSIHMELGWYRST